MSTNLQADDRPRPLPLVNDSQLQPLKGEPQPGDVLSYRLLEIGQDFSPQVCHSQCPLCMACTLSSCALSRREVFPSHSA